MSEIKRVDKMLPGETTLEYRVRVARAEERERCAKVCEGVSERDIRHGADDCVDAIRALDERTEK